MSAKQDAVAARTAADIERKYNFNRSFSEVMGLANDARDAANRANDAAEKAEAAVGGLDKSLTQEEIFNRLTKDGTMKGLYMENGELYINASYIITGEFIADLIKAGILKSKDGNSSFNLEDGKISCKDETGNSVQMDAGEFSLVDDNGVTLLQLLNAGLGAALNFSSYTGELMASFLCQSTGLYLSCYDQDSATNKAYKLQWKTVNGEKVLVGV